MAAVTEAEVRRALAAVIDEAAGRDLVSLGLVQAVTIRDGNVQLVLQVDPARGAALEPLRQRAEKAVLALSGVSSATAILTAHREAGAAAPRQPAPQQHRHDHQPRAAGGAPQKAPLNEIGAIVAVASGKGGVGKSTVTANLALALKARGLKVGVLDADIYGPSQPRLLGLSGRPDTLDGRRIIPHRLDGMPVMSIGFLVAEDTAMIWRGPMVQSAIMQMLREVEWGRLDCLIVDLPPGTGDAQLSLAQQVPLTGAVIVSTPQDIALLDVKKAMAMFRKVDVPLLGMVENMSVFVCPHCGHESHIFSIGGARREAEKQRLPFLGEVPLDPAIRETSDAGRPIVLSQPQSSAAKAYAAIADRLWQEVEAVMAGGSRKAPKITMQ
ncbi:MAG TPA: Mrp/NBP35 family ATP-binding protein [Kiloniellales bacterium]|nr:Mrp/NBP35 family ATP-binding protein [Kiloniellales bacterium]